MQSAEYLVVLEVLNRTRGRDRERLYAALHEHDRLAIDAAISRLEAAKILTVKGRTIRASPALVMLEQLNLIGI